MIVMKENQERSFIEKPQEIDLRSIFVDEDGWDFAMYADGLQDLKDKIPVNKQYGYEEYTVSDPAKLAEAVAKAKVYGWKRAFLVGCVPSFNLHSPETLAQSLGFGQADPELGEEPEADEILYGKDPAGFYDKYVDMAKYDIPDKILGGARSAEPFLVDVADRRGNPYKAVCCLVVT